MSGRTGQGKVKSELARKVGAALQRERKSKRLSQEKLAELADLSKNYIGEIERGEKEVSLGTLERIALILETRPSSLLREAGY